MCLQEPECLRKAFSGWRPLSKDADSLEQKRAKFKHIQNQISLHAAEINRWDLLVAQYGAKGASGVGLRFDVEKKKANLRGWMEWAEQLEAEIAQESRRLEVESNAAVEYLQ